MADIEVYGAAISAGRVSTLEVRFKNAGARTISRETALEWLEGGHSLITYAGSPHHGVRGLAIERVEVDGAAYLRTDVTPRAQDELHFPHAHH